MPRQAGAKCSHVGASHRALNELSDLQLLEGIRQGSEQHFGELYERYFQRIFNFVHARVKNHADTEEIVQETFVSVFKSIDNYRGQSSLLSWIFGVAKNTANNSIRRAQSPRQKIESVGAEHFTPAPSLGAASPEEQLSASRYAEAIRRQLDDMAGWQCRIFEMRHLENLSIPEIARRTHRSNDAVRSSLYRIKRMMLELAEADRGASAR